MMLRSRLHFPAVLVALAHYGCAAQASPPPVPDTEHPHRAVGDAACAFGAFVQEEDPVGLNVRSAPGTRSIVLGRLPPTLHGVGEFALDVRIAVDVLGTRDGWFRIAHAQDDDALTGRPARPVYAGEGWVSGRKLTVKSQAEAGYAAPDASGDPIALFVDGDSFDGDELVAAGHLVSCRGGWAQVEFTDRALSAQTRQRLSLKPAARSGLPPGVFRVWLDHICGVQETTCDGLGGDEPTAGRQSR